MTTLDELVVAGLGRGLDDEDLLRLLLGYREGESAGQTLTRMFPLDEKPEQLVLERSEGR